MFSDMDNTDVEARIKDSKDNAEKRKLEKIKKHFNQNKLNNII